ncbi:MAG: hypothetical protein ACLU38_13475 [Dysosmobacter sp.]
MEEFNDNWDKIDAAIAGRQGAGGTSGGGAALRRRTAGREPAGERRDR